MFNAGPNPISLSDILAYVTLRGIYKDQEIDQFLELVIMLDGVWLKDHFEKQKKQQAQDKLNSKRKQKK